MGAAPHFTWGSHSPSFVCSIKVQELPPISRTILLKIGTLSLSPRPHRTSILESSVPISNLQCHNARGNIGRSNCRRRLRTHQLSHFQRGFVRKIYGMEGWSWLDSRRCNGSYFSPQDRCG